MQILTIKSTDYNENLTTQRGRYWKFIKKKKRNKKVNKIPKKTHQTTCECHLCVM